jgi:hypothetical protein
LRRTLDHAPAFSFQIRSGGHIFQNPSVSGARPARGCEQTVRAIYHKLDGFDSMTAAYICGRPCGLVKARPAGIIEMELNGEGALGIIGGSGRMRAIAATEYQNRNCNQAAREKTSCKIPSHSASISLLDFNSQTARRFRSATRKTAHELDSK